MGLPVVVSGKVTDDESGGALVHLTTTFGAWPVGTLLVAGIILLALCAFFLHAREFFYAAASLIASGAAIYWYALKFWEARYLRSHLSECLGGIDWVLEK